MSRALRLVLGLSAAVVVVSAATDASAYCRTKACDNKPAYDDVWQETPDAPCTRDAFGCLLEGDVLHWPATCISFDVQKDGSKSDGIPFETASGVVNQAFDTWKNASCNGLPPSIEVKDHGAVSCSKAEYNQDQPNANIFMFRDTSWPHTNAEDTLALTTITYNTETAEVYDADVEINSFQYQFTTTEMPRLEDADLLAVLTHEVGHFLGLSHARLNSATMYPEYKGGDTHQRTLDPDDVEGICEIYPPDRNVDSGQCEPRHGFSSECAVAEDEGCSIGGRSSGTALGLFAPVFALFFFRRRARR